MSDKRDYTHINDLRQRLYDRSFDAPQTPNTSTAPRTTDTDVSRGWDIRPPVSQVAPADAPIPVAITETATPTPFIPAPVVVPSIPKKKRSYRLFLLLGSLGIFVFVAVVSSIYLFFGQNQISGKNITLSFTGPVATSAGDTVPLQFAITNQNSVPIISATLIVQYPPGTKSADGQRDIFEERLPVSGVSPGQALSVPTQAILYGEENEEKEIKATVEYRIEGSNSIFFKDAESIKVRISSSPLALRVTTLEKVSSGQEVDITFTITSNTALEQKNLLVTANYPNSFTFVQSEPAPSFGRNTWVIDEIKPEETLTYKIRGRVDGVTDDVSELSFSVGTPRSDNQYVVSTVLSRVATSYTIERPFIDVAVSINGDSDGDVVVPAGTAARVSIDIKNTLAEVIYDMKIAVSPSGNLIRPELLDVDTGLYDSRTNTIIWEIANMRELGEVRPGESRRVTFTVAADKDITAGSFSVSTNISSRRVGEESAEESVLGTALAQAKYASVAVMRGQVGYNNGAFGDSGPIPPVAEETTTYTLTLEARAGVNGIAAAEVTTALPLYVTWLDTYEGPGTVIYNPVSKQLRWQAGLIEPNQSAQLQFQVSVTPSITRVGGNLILVGEQILRGTDRFSNTPLTATGFEIVNTLSPEAGFPKGNDIVQRP